MAVKTFEQSMTELEDIVSKLEAGDITLDASLELFEKGIKLANFCQKKLDEAEKKVKVLTSSDDGEIIEKDFGDAE
ncbi:MAG: exodeoxyribonuclease VII small subunit [Clostridiales bacterium]|nr:exodeoxyribonuclease VII small subunit [Clostridiales bacterium]